MRITYLKKIIAIALSCLIMILSVPAMAADNPIAFADGVRIKTSDFTVAKGFNGAASTPSQKNGGTAISINKGLDFNLVPPKAGIYKLELQHKSGNPSSINIWAGFVESGLKEKIGMEHLTSGASSNNIDDWDEPTTREGWAWTTMGYAVFPTTAQRTLRLHNDTTVTGSGNGPWTGAIKLTFVEPAQLEGSDIEAVMPRGTDAFAVNYSSELNADRIDEAVITLTDSEGTDIPVNYVQVADGNSKQLVIALGKSLDYSKEYTLSIDKVADKLGYPIAGMETTVDKIVFSTSDEGGDDISDYAFAIIDSIELDGSLFTINGTMLGSKGQGIEGRKVTGAITSPEDGAEAVDMTPVMSGKNGKFAITHELDSEAPGGIYTFEVGGEYVFTGDTDTARYVSEGERKTILSMLEDSDTYSEAGSVIESYTAELGILELTDYTEIFAEGTDRNKFYTRFANASFKNSDDEYDIKVFKNVYLSSLALEHMSQADNSGVTESYINDSVYTALLGLDTAKYEYLDKKKSDFLTDVSLLGSDAFADAEAFDAEFDRLSAKYFLLEKVGYETVSLASSSAEAKQGEAISLSVSSSAPFKNATSAKLNIVFADALKDGFDDFEIETDIGEVSYDTNKNTVVCTITGIDNTKEITSIADIGFTGDNIGTGKITISGTVEAYTGTELDADVIIESRDYSVTIKSQISQSIGGGSSSGTSSSKGSVSFGGSSGSVVVPVPQTSSGPIASDTVKTYTDLGNVEWAKEAINGLYSMQVIAMPDDGMFYPERNITRAEFIKMVVLAKNYVRGSLTKVEFNDVSADDWFFQYVEAAVNSKLIEGDGTGNFRPNDLITREDICVILSRILKSSTLDDIEPFADDASISEYAKTAVYVMKDSGIVNGVGDNNFAPKSNATRAEAAKIIYGTVK